MPDPGPPAPAGRSATSDAADLVRAVERVAPTWFDHSGTARVAVDRVEDRTQSMLLHLTVESDDTAVAVVVKVPRAAAADPSCRPRLVAPVRDPAHKARLEHGALRAVEEHFAALGDGRLGWVHVYDHLPDWAALVVESIDDPTLDERLRARPSHSFERRDRPVVLGRLGAWLAEYHRIETPEMQDRGGTVPSLVADLRRLIAMRPTAARTDGRRDRLGAVVDHVESVLEGTVVRMGLGHGDFAPRNVFVGDDHRVTVIDSLGRFRVPIQEDAAYLLVDLATGATRFARHGLPTSREELDRLRSAFLDGYPMADDPLLWAFELRALLDKDRSLGQRARRRTAGGNAKALVDAMRRRLLAREIERVSERLSPG